MKKLIAFLLALVMCAGLVACGAPTEPNQDPAGESSAVSGDALADAIAYIKTVYKNPAEVTGKDYERIGVVPVGTEKYEVIWTVDVAEDLVKIVKNDNGMITIDVNETTPEEVAYVLTATITSADGKSESHSWNHIVPAYVDINSLSHAQIVDLAYALEDGVVTDDSFRLQGTITKIDTAWSEDYQNITVTIAVEGKESQPIMCYRLKGEGAKDLHVGDVIVVEGVFKNYKGTIEFDAGCALVEVVSKAEVIVVDAPSDTAEIIDAAYALEDGASLPYTATLTGTISNVDTAWSDQYKNITVTIQVKGSEDQPIMCFRLKGEGAETLGKGDVITVTGTLKNYSGTIEFDAGCTLDKINSKAAAESKPVESQKPVEAPTDPAKIIKAAYKLEDGEQLPYTATLTGTIASVDTAWNDQYGNITVTIKVKGSESKPIMCYRLKGNGAETLGVGDVITVTGTLKNYKGTIEFDAGCTLDKINSKAPVESAPVETKPVETQPVETKPVETQPVESEKPVENADTATVDAAYALDNGKSLSGKKTLTGTIVNINTAYDSNYKNISVDIRVEGRESKPILCYRMKGSGAEDLAVGDVITVTGTLKNYNGTIEFDTGCTLDKVVANAGTVVVSTDAAKVLDEASKLESGAYLSYNATLTGSITKIKSKYDSKYNNITVILQVNGVDVECYRLRGDGIKNLKVGDTISVTGMIENYKGSIQFSQGCVLD